MNAISNSNLLQSLGWSVFNSLWQMALLWIVYQLIVYVFNINKSSQKSGWAAVFLFAGFGWFVFTFISLVYGNNNPGSISFESVVSVVNSKELNRWVSYILPVVSLVYLVLLILPVLNFIRNYRYVQTIRRYGLSKADVYWRIFAQKVAAQMGISRPVFVWMSDLVKSPVTIGYLKPVILLPLASINHLTTQQTEAILLHELAHIKRYDYFINLLSRAIQTILYFNPFAGAFGKVIQKEREKSCDETVIQFQYEPHSYASALVTLEKVAYMPVQSFAVAAADGKKSELRQRIEWILGVHKQPSFSFTRLAGVMLALLCFIGLNALLIMSRPLKSNGNAPLTFLSSPFNFSGDTGNDSNPDNNTTAEQNGLIVNTPAETNAEPVNNEAVKPVNKSEAIQPGGNSEDYAFVSHLQQVMPALDAAQEKKVQEALVESKRVMEEAKWKEMEKGIADAMTLMEKNKMKEEYKKAMSQLDMQKVEDQMRLAYEEIDWNRINAELSTALTEIKIDSLNNVYNIAISALSDLQKQLTAEKQPGIPDSDISLKTIESQKKELEKTLIKLKAARPKKIVHL